MCVERKGVDVCRREWCVVRRRVGVRKKETLRFYSKRVSCVCVCLRTFLIEGERVCLFVILNVCVWILCTLPALTCLLMFFLSVTGFIVSMFVS